MRTAEGVRNERSERRSRPSASAEGDGAERSVSGVERRHICDSKCGFAALRLGSFCVGAEAEDKFWQMLRKADGFEI